MASRSPLIWTSPTRMLRFISWRLAPSPADRRKFVSAYQGKRVCVTGKINEAPGGGPFIMAADRTQVQVQPGPSKRISLIPCTSKSQCAGCGSAGPRGPMSGLPQVWKKSSAKRRKLRYEEEIARPFIVMGRSRIVGANRAPAVCGGQQRGGYGFRYGSSPADCPGSVLIAMPVQLSPDIKVISVTDNAPAGGNTYKQVVGATASCGKKSLEIWYCENCNPEVTELKFHLSGHVRASLNGFFEFPAWCCHPCWTELERI